MGSLTLLEKPNPHAICIPFPAQGHINPMLNVAKLLHHNGFHITFVNTHFNHNRLLKSRGTDALDALPSFQFKSIPDGLPPSDPNATQDIPSICESTSNNCLAPFKDLLAKLNDTSTSNVPPVSCIIADGLMTFTLAAAEELGVPEVFLWTSSACGYLGYFQYRKLIEKGIIPLKDVNYVTNGYLDQVLDWIPGMKDIRLKDLPSFLRTTNPDDCMIKFVLHIMDITQKASAIILNTFEELDHDVIESLSSITPPIFCIGPLHFLAAQVNDESLNILGSNLWKVETESLEWLDSKEVNSVIYVNFGSITVMSPEQLMEFAWGLANSKLNFLWIIRPGLVNGDSAILPPEFLEETKDRGLWKTLYAPFVGAPFVHPHIHSHTFNVWDLEK